MVTGKGYRNRALVSPNSARWGLRTYCSGTQPRTAAVARATAGNNKVLAVYANRRRIRGERGALHLLRQRGEKLERWNQHLYDQGGMRRLHFARPENILKRLVVHAFRCGQSSGFVDAQTCSERAYAARLFTGTISAVTSAVNTSIQGLSGLLPATLCSEERLRRLDGSCQPGSDDYRRGLKTARFTSRC